MLTDVGLFLDLNSIEQFLFLKAEPNADGEFVIHEILTHFVKNDHSVILLSTSQLFLHYSNVGLKLGINTKQLKEKRQIVCFDILKSFSECLGSLDKSKPEDIITSSLIQSKPKLQPLFELIKQTVEEMITKKYKILLIIDDILLFLSFGASVGEILDFVHYCRLLIKRYNGCLLICSHDIFDDEENQQINTMLSHLCDKLIAIERLSTGHSREIDGKICLSLKDKLKRVTETRKKYFQTEDKSVKLLSM